VDIEIALLERIANGIIALRGDIAALAPQPPVMVPPPPPPPPVTVDLGPVTSAVEAVREAVLLRRPVEVPPPPPPQPARIDPADLEELVQGMGRLVAARPRERMGVRLGGGSKDGQHVRDFFRHGEALASQTGAAGVLTFTFARDMSLIVIRPVGGDVYVDPFGGTPADGTGVYVPDEEPAYIPIQTRTVQVYAPVGAEVYVHGLAYHEV
jgi:hypothetical protein